MEKLKAAVIGLGRMGAEHSSRFEGRIPDGWLPISHAEAIQSIEELELVALCDTDEIKLKKMSEDYHISHSYCDYKKLIDDISPDFLCIATRTLERIDIIKYACEHGAKIIYFEKPVSRSIADCKKILNVIRYNNVIVGYGVNRRYHSTYRKAKEIIKSGELGELLEINVEHGHANLYWSHPHSSDIILFFAESTDLEFIQGTCTFQEGYKPKDFNFIDDDPLVDNAYFQFKNGIKASVNQTKGLNVRLACTKGILTIYADGSFIEIRNGTNYFTQSQIITLSDIQSATVTAFKELLNLMNNKSFYPITLKEIETGLLMLNGLIYSSLNEGKRISPESIPLNMIITGRSGINYA